MLRARWLLCFTLVASTASLAQATREVPPAPGEELPSTPPPLVPAPRPAADSASQEEEAPRGALIPRSYEGESSRLPTGARISLEVIGGAASMAASGLLAYYGAGALLGDCSDALCSPFILVPMSGAMFLGTPLGVSVAGDLAGGRGAYWSALLGMVVGTGAAAVLVVALKGDLSTLQAVSMLSIPILGAVVGYELLHAYRQPHPAGLARANTAGVSPQVIPLVGVTPHGGFFGGLAARF